MHTIRKVVIIGGGFAGLQLARKLSNQAAFAVILIDRFNYHQFQPLFYQVATGGLDASNISFPLRKVFHNSRNVRIRLDKVTAIDTHAQIVHTENGTQAYDDLVIATGADTNFFGNAELEQHTYPMKSTVEALQLRHKIISNFEAYLHAEDPVQQQRLLTIAVVGGGPTGVELSGAIAEMKSYVLPKDYPEIDFSKMRILLLEGTSKTLGAMSESSSRQSRQYLEELGVEVLTNTIMESYNGQTIHLKDGNSIESGLVIWAAGIKGNVPQGIDPALVVRGNRIRVNRFNQVEGFSNVYALGDVAWMQPGSQSGRQLAQTWAGHATMAALRIQGFRQHGHSRPQQSSGRPAQTQVAFRRPACVAGMDVFAPDADTRGQKQTHGIHQLDVQLPHLRPKPAAYFQRI